MVKNYNCISLKNSLIVLLFFITFQGFSQDSLLLRGKFSDFSVDNIGNVYTVVKKDTLFKYSATSVMPNYNYVNSSLGDITQIDTSNPLQIIVLHGDVSTLVFLDVTLREVQRIRLPGIGIYSNPVAFAQNADGTIWVYDDVNASVVRVNSSGNQIDKSLSLIQQLDFVPEISQMQSNNEYIVLLDKENGFIVLDQFAELIDFMPQKNKEYFQLINKHIAYKEDHSLRLLPIELAGINTVDGFELDSSEFRIHKEFIYQKTKQGISKTKMITEEKEAVGNE